MSYGMDRGPEFVYHVPWGVVDPAAPTPRSAPARVAAPKFHAPRTPEPRPVPDVEETPLYAASSLLDTSTPVAVDPSAEDTPLFHAVPHYEEVRRADEERLIRTFHSLPGRWQEVLWFTQVEDVSITEASIHMRVEPETAAALVDEAVTGLRRAWVADDLDGQLVPQTCASALWALCGTDGWRGLGHVRDCERCSDVARRLQDVVVRTSQVLLPVALAHIEDAYDRAV